MKKISIRFYEELNDFLPAKKRKKRFEYEFTGTPSIKDMIESLGIPHTEIDLILVNGKPVDFSYLIRDEDDISVYPVFESFDISEHQKLRDKPLREPKFILDVHLGTLAKYMRILGFNIYYKNNLSDEDIVKISGEEKRTILTRDTGILKRSEVTHGSYVRNTNPEKQLKEVIKRFHLEKEIREFSRCLLCNEVLSKIEKEKIENRLPPKVKAIHHEFYFCKSCDKIYWKGTHYDRMKEIVSIFTDN